MRNLTKLRALLGAVTLLGAFHLNAAAAPRAEAAKAGDCYAEAYNTGWWACEDATGGNWEWGIVWYTEYPDGSCSVDAVECYAT